jgi:hypothetical protein
MHAELLSLAQEVLHHLTYSLTLLFCPGESVCEGTASPSLQEDPRQQWVSRNKRAGCHYEWRVSACSVSAVWVLLAVFSSCKHLF